MKKKLILIFILSSICLISGCAKPKYPDFKIQGNGINFVYKIENERLDHNPYSFVIRIFISKDVFFDQLKSNQYFVEQYNDKTMVFFKSINNKSAYFTITKRSINDNSYSCRGENLSLYDDTTSLNIAFPCYVLKNGNALFNEDIETDCNFDYIKSFYQRMENIVVQEGDDHIIIKSYSYYYDDSMFSDNNIKIEKKGEDTIVITKAVEVD